MEVLITDLTRMYDGHICVVGIDIATGKRVRPVVRGRLPASTLSTRGGVMNVRHIVDLGRTHRHRARVAPDGPRAHSLPHRRQSPTTRRPAATIA